MPAPTVTLPEFIAKWSASTRNERAAAHEHFIDLCRLLGQPTPNEADPTGDFYAFEKGVTKTAGGDGFADVWRRGYFAWEYKGKHKNLVAAYQQLLQYREDLDNPPLLVVCDLDRFEVHTNYTGTTKRIYAFTLADLATPAPTPTSALAPLDVLRALFAEPRRLRPQQTATEVTEHAAAEFARLAESLRQRGADPEQAAHFLMRLLFCLFAEDIGLLPARLFTRLVEGTRTRPAEFTRRLRSLFGAMASGGFFGEHDIAYFNGGLFAGEHVLDLTGDDLAVLARAAQLDWASIEPAIFGTLFERSLDPAKRAQLGAHYTSRDDILLIVEPVVLAPLRRRWAEVQTRAQEVIAQRDAAAGGVRTRHQQTLQRLLTSFAEEVAALRVLDPACGSGNFLYVALKRLLDLEKEVITFAATNGVGGFFPRVGPEQLHGIEINLYAHELASIVVWIGYIQWLHDNGFGQPSDPILKPLHTIERMDAILAYDAKGRPVEPEWPAADVIIGNPPFLGGNRVRRALGDDRVNALFHLYDGRVPRFADLVCYWFEHARAAIAEGRAKRAGLLATQAIRGGANRVALERITATGNIFWAHSDRNWVLDGAMVHVSMVGFDDGTEASRMLNDQPVSCIYADLTSAIDLLAARRLRENLEISFQGPSPKAPFDIDEPVARRMLALPLNVNNRPNADVVRPLAGALDLAQRSRRKWTIDFSLMPFKQAAEYEAPFEYVREHVLPARQGRRDDYRGQWWQYARPRPEMRAALAGLARYIGTPRHAKHRVFVWVDAATLCNDATIVFARDDDYFFGIVQSRPHELWARATGTQLREAESGFRYTPTTTFETFPFPWPPGCEPADDPRVVAIAEAARELVEKRDRWLNPPGASDAELKTRTLTNLYNQRPTWLDQAHKKLDAAVLDAYGWPHALSNEEILGRLLALNLEREPA
jgi:SAM-dependent methyltransferase